MKMRNTLFFYYKDGQRRRCMSLFEFDTKGVITATTRIYEDWIGRPIWEFMSDANAVNKEVSIYCRPIRLDSTDQYPLAEMLKKDRENEMA